VSSRQATYSKISSLLHSFITLYGNIIRIIKSKTNNKIATVDNIYSRILLKYDDSAAFITGC